MSTPTQGVDVHAVRRWILAALLVAGVSLVLVLLAGGGAPHPSPAGLPDAGPVTGWGLPAVRLVADLAGVVTVGLFLSAGFLLPSRAARLSPLAGRGVQLATRSALVWAAAVAVETALTVSDIFGTPPGRILSPGVLRSFVTQIPQGRALVVQLVLALVVAGVARVVLTSRGAALGVLLALAALAPPVLTGHSAASGNHDLAVASLLVHVVAAALWVGGVGALAWTGATATRREARSPGSPGSAGSPASEPGLGHAVPRFSWLAGACCAAVGLSGVVNASVRLRGLGDWTGTAYGRLALVKALALVVLGVFGWWHRRHTVAQLARDPDREVRSLFTRVAAVELLVMTATGGVAVGLARTPTPAGPVVDNTPSSDLLGFALPPAPDAARLAFEFTPDGFALTFLLVAAVLYAVGLRVLRRRGDAWPWGRVLAWYAGLAVIAWATVGGVGLYAHVLFSTHMVAHMLLSMIAPIGLVLGAPIMLALRTLPGPRVPGELGLRQMLMKVLQSRPAKVVGHPVVATALFVGSLYGLYYTSLFPALMSNHLGHVLMTFHFITVGFLFFWVLIGIDPTPTRLPPLARTGLLLVTMPFHAFFAVELLGSTRIIAPGYYATLQRPYSTDLLADQHLGAAATWAIGEVPIVLVMIAIFVQWVRSDARDAARADRQFSRPARSADPTARGSAPAAGSGSGETDLDRYNAYLAALSRHDERGPLRDHPVE